MTLTTALGLVSGGLGIAPSPANGQILIGNGGTAFTLATLTAGSGISVTNGAGSVTLANSGIVSLTAGTGISVSGSTITNSGIVTLAAGTGITVSSNTVTNAGVLAFLTSLSGLTPTVASTGTVTLGGTLGVAGGGTGAGTLTANGLLVGNGTSAVTTLAPGSNGNLIISNGTSFTTGLPNVGLNYTINGGGSAPATGWYGYLKVPFAGVITAWAVFTSTSAGAQSDTVALDVTNNTTFGTNTSMVGAGTKPGTSAASSATGTPAGSSWAGSTTIASGGYIGFQLTTAPSTATIVNIMLTMQRTSLS